MHDSALLQNVLRPWDRELGRVCAELPLSGSPERCLSRLALEDQEGQCLVLEEHAEQFLPVKRRIAAQLKRLHQNGLRVPAPCLGPDGQAIQEVQGRFWQLTPFVPSLPLDHATYWQESWRGRALAGYLADLRAAAKGLPLEEPCFDLPGYVRRIAMDAARHHAWVVQELRPVWEVLEGLPLVHARLPTVFSHGDPHPENILWGQSDIRAAIDWEFCGPKHILYDPALVIGCVGTEAPEAGDGPFVRAFLAALREHGLLEPTTEQALPMMVLAQRIPWLAEWLRRDDREMIEFEVFYLKFLSGLMEEGLLCSCGATSNPVRPG
ncbi:phosphotransferase enzyme family protein [Desulfonatronum thiodismutans]|uniref:phosphotransferase enzyme family protein n=1 Tax=Desulfonatronum thiodismutans TaxID=159290 RepID=UPI0004ABE3CE|nr:phosphotransferase [Desulfonatronum thiodismutans]